MSPNIIQEQLSRAYVRAVVYKAGFRLYWPDPDDHGIDGTIVDPSRRRVNRGDFQLKATTRHSIVGDHIIYDLRVQNYNQLITEDDVPRVLILFIMPDNPDEWLAQSADEMCLRKCAYWLSLMGEQRSSNASHRRVSVPLADVLSRGGLNDMFRRLIS